MKTLITALIALTLLTGFMKPSFHDFPAPEQPEPKLCAYYCEVCDLSYK